MIWQPIETAPKDGTKIVLARWDENYDRWEFWQSHWRKYALGYGEGFGTDDGYDATHWAPLP